MSDEKKRECSKCGQTKSESEFYVGKKHKQCKQCMREDNKNRYVKTDEPRSGFDRLTEDQKTKMLEMFLGGVHQKDIAQQLGIPLGNVQLWLKPGGKARMLLMNRIKPPAQPPQQAQQAPAQPPQAL